MFNRKSKSMAIITDRDRKILAAIFEHKVLDAGSIAQLFFKETTNLSIARDRLSRLFHAGYLDRTPTIRDNRIYNVYSVTKKGIKQFNFQYGHEIANEGVASNSIEHDLMLFKIRAKCHKLSMCNGYLTESMLQSCRELRDSFVYSNFLDLKSDGVLLISTPERTLRCAIEYEGSEKAISRYIEKLSDYYSRDCVDVIFYICETPRVMRTIYKADKESSQYSKSKLFAILTKDFLSPSEKIILKSHSGSEFVLE
jgi:hypothetical protein